MWCINLRTLPRLQRLSDNHLVILKTSTFILVKKIFWPAIPRSPAYVPAKWLARTHQKTWCTYLRTLRHPPQQTKRLMQQMNNFTFSILFSEGRCISLPLPLDPLRLFALFLPEFSTRKLSFLDKVSCLTIKIPLDTPWNS